MEGRAPDVGVSMPSAPNCASASAGSAGAGRTRAIAGFATELAGALGAHLQVLPEKKWQETELVLAATS